MRAIYDRTADRYDRSTPDGGRAIGDGRAWLAGQARGRTLEVGIGSGRTLPFYAADIELTGIELSPVMLAKAIDRADRVGRKADLLLGDATSLPFADASFDTVSFCLVLCTVPDDAQAFAEAVRVLRPSGRIVAFEHVRSPNRIVRVAERLMQPFAIRADADHLLRDPLDHVRRHDLAVEHLERRLLGIMERLVARKP